MAANEADQPKRGFPLSVDWWAVLVAAVLVVLVVTGVIPNVGW